MYTARSVLSLTSPRLPHRPGVEVVGYWVGFAFPLGFLLFSLSSIHTEGGGSGRERAMVVSTFTGPGIGIGERPRAPHPFRRGVSDLAVALILVPR